jgi:hypothetical protein
LPGRFEVVRVCSLEPAEVDRELHPLLGIGPFSENFDPGAGGALLKDYFREAQTECLVAKPWGEREAVFSGRIGREWARAARRLEDTLPIECGVDWRGPRFIYIRSLKHDPEAMQEWRAAEGRAIGRELTAAADRLEARGLAADIAADADLLVELRAAATRLTGAAAAVTAGGADEGVGPAPAAETPANSGPDTTVDPPVPVPSPAPEPPTLSHKADSVMASREPGDDDAA